MNNQRRNRRLVSKVQRYYSELEPRRLLATFTVNTTLDDGGTTSDGLVSLREAIIAANTNAAFGDAPAGDSGVDTIVFDSSLDGQTIQIGQDSIPISEGLTIRGTGVDVTIQAYERDWIFEANTDQEIRFTNLNLFGVEDNYGLGGGGISMTGGGMLRLTNSSFEGLGITSNHRAVHIEGGSLRVVNSTFRGNYSHSGAALFVDGSDSIIVGSTFEGNMVESTGGAIQFRGGQHFVSQSDFIGNYFVDLDTYGGGEGGAIQIINSASVHIFGGEFTSNLSGRGGAISNSGELVVQNGTVFKSNRANGRSDQIRFLADGGAIFNRGQLRLVDAVIESNNAQKGAGIYHSGGSALLIRTSILNNVASIDGGGMVVTNANARLVDSTIEGNKAGGNVVVDDGFDLSRQYLGNGGGIFFTSRLNSTLEINGGSTSNNTAEVNGGGIYAAPAWEEARIYVNIFNGTTISQNRTNRVYDPVDPGEPHGGGIYTAAAALQVNDVTINENRSTGYGGGIHVAAGIARLSNSSIAANRAQWDGGGINISNGNVTLYQSTVGGDVASAGNLAGEFSANGTRGLGGGINISNDSGTSRLMMIGGLVGWNKAKISGGGIYVANHGNVVRIQNNGFVSNNSALVANGGGIYNDGAHLELRDSVFEKNLARNGGGIYQNAGSTRLAGSRVQLNEARRTGGGLFARGFHRIIDSSIENNLARFFPNFFDAD